MKKKDALVSEVQNISFPAEAQWKCNFAAAVALRPPDREARALLAR